ncbi:MAG: hypothetical protein K9K32_03620 [Halanaerobiales bacterium]|nr:hypothetical protein [Halanaerobiales bacterium]
MKLKISVFVIVALLILSLGGQFVIASSGDSAKAKMSVTIIELSQDIGFQSPVVFDVDSAVVVNEDSEMFVKEAGSTVIKSSTPWKLFASAPVDSDLEVFLRVANDGTREWTSLSDQPVLASRAPGEFNFVWDVMVVGDNLSQVESFTVDFELKGY